MLLSNFKESPAFRRGESQASPNSGVVLAMEEPSVSTANPPCASSADGYSTRITRPSLKTFTVVPLGSRGGRKTSIWTATANGGVVGVRM